MVVVARYHELLIIDQLQFGFEALNLDVALGQLIGG